jgi:hypothetical protein
MTEKLRMKKPYVGSGKVGTRLGPDVELDIWYTPIKWDTEDVPKWIDAVCLEPVPELTQAEQAYEDWKVTVSSLSPLDEAFLAGWDASRHHDCSKCDVKQERDSLQKRLEAFNAFKKELDKVGLVFRVSYPP